MDFTRIVEGLLNKAEATTFPEERDALISKAQELITKHAIDEGILDMARAARGEARKETISSARFCEERNTKLIKAKRELIMYLAEVNNGYVVMGHGRAYMLVTAHASDLRMVQALYASIIVQMATAMNRAEAQGEVVGPLAGWRVSYAHGYVRKVGHRLIMAKRAAQAAASEPGTMSTALVLADRKDAVQKAYNSQHGEARKGRKIPTSDRNPFGASTGRRDGQRADLGGERIGTTERRELS
jgi:hypothetical protein